MKDLLFVFRSQVRFVVIWHIPSLITDRRYRRNSPISATLLLASSQVIIGIAIGGKTRTKIASMVSNPVQIGSKVIAIRDFWVEPFFDSGWWVERGMRGVCRYLIEEGPVIDFNAAFGNTDGQLGDICLVCPEDALEVVDERS